MNDLDWIKYYPSKMFVDTVGMSAHGERAHRRLFDYLLINDGPPPAEDETLRQISNTSPSDWGRTKQELIRKGWVQLGESFLHRGAVKTLNESKETYVANHNRTCRANGLPPMSLSTPHPETGVVCVVPAAAAAGADVTPPVTKDVTRTQNRTEQPPEPKIDRLTRLKIQSQGKEGGVGEEGKAKSGKAESGKPSADGDDLLDDNNRRTLADAIVRNDWGWHYDNCKLAPGDLLAASLSTSLKAFRGRLTLAEVWDVWMSTATAVHQAVVDGLPNAVSAREQKRLGAYTSRTFTEKLAKAVQGGTT